MTNYLDPHLKVGLMQQKGARVEHLQFKNINYNENNLSEALGHFRT